MPKGKDAKPRVYSGHQNRYDSRVAGISLLGSLVLCVKALVSLCVKCTSLCRDRSSAGTHPLPARDSLGVISIISPSLASGKDKGDYGREAVYDSDSSEEVIHQLMDDNACFDSHIVDKLLIDQAMANLKPQEVQVIAELFGKQKQVSQLCKELQVSRKTVQRTKKIALNKLRRFIDCS